jgi:hypothetical protein
LKGEGRLSLDDIKAMPQGMNGFYEGTFRRLFPTDDSGESAALDQLRLTLQILVAAQRVLSFEELASFLSE